MLQPHQDRVRSWIVNDRLPRESRVPRFAILFPPSRAVFFPLQMQTPFPILPDDTWLPKSPNSSRRGCLINVAKSLGSTESIEHPETPSDSFAPPAIPFRPGIFVPGTFDGCPSVFFCACFCFCLCVVTLASLALVLDQAPTRRWCHRS